MARRVFFSFHYSRDISRVSIVRNANVIDKPQGQQILDHADWEAVKRRGPAAVRNWIDDQLVGASVTVVLIGQETASRPWVKYEVEKSYRDGKGLLGVRIHCIRNFQGNVDSPGPNPFGAVQTGSGLFGRPSTLADEVPVYDWVANNGRLNLGRWVEEAARRVGR